MFSGTCCRSWYLSCQHQAMFSGTCCTSWYLSWPHRAMFSETCCRSWYLSCQHRAMFSGTCCRSWYLSYQHQATFSVVLAVHFCFSLNCLPFYNFWLPQLDFSRFRNACFVYAIKAKFFGTGCQFLIHCAFGKFFVATVALVYYLRTNVCFLQSTAALQLYLLHRHV